MDKKKIIKAVKDILQAVGDNPKRPDLLETPKRVAEMYEEILGGMKKIRVRNSKFFSQKITMR